MASGTSSKSRSKKLEKDSPSGVSPLTSKLNQSLVVAKDLKLQPNSKYVLLTGAGRLIYYAVDWVREQFPGVVAFGLDGDKEDIVYQCRLEGTWALVNRNAVTICTDADMARHQVEEGKEVEDFYAKLDPKGWEEAQKLAASGGLEALLYGQGAAPRHEHKDDGKPVPGQYL